MSHIRVWRILWFNLGYASESGHFPMDFITGVGVYFLNPSVMVIVRPLLINVTHSLKDPPPKSTQTTTLPTSAECSYNAVADPGFPRRGGANPREGAPTYYLTNFSQKLHENEENFTQRGGRASLRPPLDPPMQCPIVPRMNVRVRGINIRFDTCNRKFPVLEYFPRMMSNGLQTNVRQLLRNYLVSLSIGRYSTNS